jgi:hypothetical protein
MPREFNPPPLLLLSPPPFLPPSPLPLTTFPPPFLSSLPLNLLLLSSPTLSPPFLLSLPLPHISLPPPSPLSPSLSPFLTPLPHFFLLFPSLPFFPPPSLFYSFSFPRLLFSFFSYALFPSHIPFILTNSPTLSLFFLPFLPPPPNLLSFIPIFSKISCLSPSHITSKKLSHLTYSYSPLSCNNLCYPSFLLYF